MAVPTIATISPARGHTGGRTLVKITGTNFKLPDDPPADVHPVPEAAPSVAVTFGGVAALDVQLVDDETILCLSPICELTNADGIEIPGVVDIVVSNIDASGDVVSGETVTSADAFEYLRPDLSADSYPWFVVDRMLRQLQLQIVSRVTFAVHSDASDPDAIDFDRIPEAPCLVLTDLDFLGSNRVAQGPQEIDIGDGKFVLRRGVAGLDAEFTLVGIADDSTKELITLLAGTHIFFQKNPKLRVPRSMTDPSAGYLELDLEFAPLQGMRVTAGSSESNIKTFAKVVAIRGIPLEDLPGAPNESTDDVPDGIAGEPNVSQGYVVDAVEVAAFKKDPPAEDD